MEANREMIENNKVTISGEIVSSFEFSHELYGERFYTAYLESERLSERKDVIPVMVSERLADVNADWEGQFVKISGQFRSYNKRVGKKRRVILLVFARELKTVNPFSENKILLNGYVCKMPTYRETPLGREIADILLAVNRPYGKSDYIPCIAWGRNAGFASGLEVGTRLKAWGRIQSREYQKKISDNEVETRTAYEVSISKMEVVEDGQRKD